MMIPFLYNDTTTVDNEMFPQNQIWIPRYQDNTPQHNIDNAPPADNAILNEKHNNR